MDVLGELPRDPLGELAQLAAPRAAAACSRRRCRAPPGRSAVGVVPRAAASSAARSTSSFTAHSWRPASASSAASSAAPLLVEHARAPCLVVEDRAQPQRHDRRVLERALEHRLVSARDALEPGRSFRLRRSGSSPNSASGTRLTSAARRAALDAARPRRSPDPRRASCSGRAGPRRRRDAVRPRSRAHPRTARLLARLEPRARAARGARAAPWFLALEPARRSARRSPRAEPSAWQRRVALPPVDPHLARPVDGGDQQPQLDRQQLDVEQVDLDVAGDDDALVEHPLEDVGEVRVVLAGRPGRPPDARFGR